MTIKQAHKIEKSHNDTRVQPETMSLGDMIAAITGGGAFGALSPKDRERTQHSNELLALLKRTTGNDWREAEIIAQITADKLVQTRSVDDEGALPGERDQVIQHFRDLLNRAGSCKYSFFGAGPITNLDVVERMNQAGVAGDFTKLTREQVEIVSEAYVGQIYRWLTNAVGDGLAAVLLAGAAEKAATEGRKVLPAHDVELLNERIGWAQAWGYDHAEQFESIDKSEDPLADVPPVAAATAGASYEGDFDSSPEAASDPLAPAVGGEG